jgi:hypothetical protein
LLPSFRIDFLEPKESGNAPGQAAETISQGIFQRRVVVRRHNLKIYFCSLSQDSITPFFASFHIAAPMRPEYREGARLSA